MKLNKKIFQIIIFIETVVIFFLLFLFLQIKIVSNNKPATSPSVVPLAKLKAKYFDDLTPKWLSGDEIRAADSKYAARTAPQPIIHPLGLTVLSETLQPVKRSEITNPASTIVDEMYSKYGETLGGYFSSKDKQISSYIKADIDSDGTEEEIVETVQIAGNHPPWDGYVVKNGKIILTFPLNSGGIEPAKDKNGFYVMHQLYGDQGACCPTGYRVYRVVFEGSAFKPVWEQDVTYVSPVNNSDNSSTK